MLDPNVFGYPTPAPGVQFTFTPIIDDLWVVQWVTKKLVMPGI
jgi:hypothetical protein